MKIVFLGGGNMANALIGGMVKQGFAASDIDVIDPDAIDLACGLIFRKPVEPQDVPADAVEWLADIDRAGRDVTQFAA